jgi:hypothetical protein
LKERAKGVKKGWKVPINQSYVPIGEFKNVAHALKKVKKKFPHAN